MLAFFSGVLFAANNLFIQMLEVEPLEMLLVRSIVQCLVLGIVAADHPTPREKRTWSAVVFVGLQALFGGFRLLLTFACLTYLPLGDALTLMFSEPLFTVVLSTVLLRTGGLTLPKLGFCVSLVIGMLFCVQPPLLFGSDKSSKEVQTDEEDEDNSNNYFIGAILAVTCAICGALCNICITRYFHRTNCLRKSHEKSNKNKQRLTDAKDFGPAC